MVALFPCRNDETEARRAFSWRNDPETVASSYLPRPKTWDSFWLEYSECYFRDSRCGPVFIADGNRDVGFIRFEPVSLPEGEAFEIMINVAPEYRRRGIGTAALDVVKKAPAFRGAFALVADIRRENTASIRLFEKSGFLFFGERNEYIEKINENCRILCYRYIL